MVCVFAVLDEFDVHPNLSVYARHLPSGEITPVFTLFPLELLVRCRKLISEGPRGRPLLASCQHKADLAMLALHGTDHL
jgi:hypothetical protein